jgi:hypothetical protein
MARFSSLCADRPLADDRTRLHCFERFVHKSLRRSEQLFRVDDKKLLRWLKQICISTRRHPARSLGPQHRIAGCVQMDTVDGVMFGHGRQSDKAGSGLLGELRQDRVAAVDRRAALAFIATAL